MRDKERRKDHWATGQATHFSVTLYGRRLLPRVRPFLTGPLRERIRPRKALMALMDRVFPSA